MNDTKTVSGAIVHVTDADEAPLVKCLVDIVPKQSGSGTPSPSNVRQISGWESVSVNVSGKNMLDQSAYTSLDATSYSNGVFTAETLSAFNSAMVRLYKNGAVVDTINKAPTEGSRVSINVTVNDTWDACFIGYRMGGVHNIGGLFNKPIVADGTYTVSFMADKIPSTSVYGKFSNIQLELGTTATTFEPYNGTTTPVNLGRTVYGGTLDVVSGSLTVDKEYRDLGAINWTRNTSYNVFISDTITNGATAIPEGYANAICSNYATYYTGSSITLSQIPNNNIVFSTTSASGSPRFIVKDTRYTDGAALKTALSGVIAVFPLATPQTYTLTGQEMTALYGENYIWANAGDIDIEYTYLPYGLYGEIRLDGNFLPKPRNFMPAREDVYAGEYTTCTGKTIADRIGWKFSDLDLQWDALKQSDIDKLINLTNACSLRFDDADGLHTEDVIRSSAVSLRNRNTVDGETWWRNVSVQFKFIDTHNND